MSPSSVAGRWLLAATAVVLVTACASPEQRAAKLRLQEQRETERLHAMNAPVDAAALRPAATVVVDQTLPLENLLAALTRCDASFSATLTQYAPQLGTHFALDQHGTSATIAVADRKTPGRGNVRALGNPMAFGFPVTGYFDEVSMIGDKPVRAAWGFYTSVPPEEVVRLAGGQVEGFRHVNRDKGNGYIRMSIFLQGSWQPTRRYAYFRQQSALAGERSFQIAPSREAAFPGSRISCSLRGDQLQKLLPSLRPDLY